jgi:hypothetical protein
MLAAAQVYFSFITMTTIGLGDLTPTGPTFSSSRASTLVGYILLIFFGLSMTGACFAAIQDFAQFSRGLAAKNAAKLVSRLRPKSEPPVSVGEVGIFGTEAAAS